MQLSRTTVAKRVVKCLRIVLPVISLVILIILALLSVRSARADIAPPDQPPGANPVPGAERTQVRMQSESVLIEILNNTPSASLGQARVTAQFSMMNLGEKDEKLAVRFPLTFLSGGDNGFGSFPEIKEFSAGVNGYAVQFRRVVIPGQQDSETGVPWAEFDVNFLAGKEVPVEVSYLTEGVGEYPFISFKYILETGAGWRDTIGEADLTVRLPYEANDQNVIFDEQIGWSQTTPGSVLVGREVQWKFYNLEPDASDNLEVSLVMPSVWKQILVERENTTLNSRDGEAWGRLGKLYKDIISYRRGLRQDPGGLDLYKSSVAAYERCLELLPRDALWHAGFADLLFRNYYWGQFFREYPDHSDVLRALDEFRIALALDPNNPKILELVDELTYSIPEAVHKDGDQYIFLWLTATPTSRPTVSVTPTASPEMPSATTPPRRSPTPQLAQAGITPSQEPSTPTSPPLGVQPVMDTQVAATTPTPRSNRLPICGGSLGMMAALLFAGSLFWSRRRGI
jgi:tetratricopeptide (TPR) repeat protein